jgi:hypothetical protein
MFPGSEPDERARQRHGAARETNLTTTRETTDHDANDRDSCRRLTTTTERSGRDVGTEALG